MREAVIVDTVRTPLGKRNGGLAGWHAADLAGELLSQLAVRNALDPALVDDVILGCVTQFGRQAVNLGRFAVLAAGWPDSVPATTIDRQCGSSQQSLQFAAQGVIAGSYDVVVAAGVEVMSTTPLGAGVPEREHLMGPRTKARYQSADGSPGVFHQGVAAEMIADRWGLDREALDKFGFNSQRRALAATESGKFAEEIVPVEAIGFDHATDQPIPLDRMVTADEGIRDTTIEGLARLKPVFAEDGLITAGTSSQITDGASAVLVAERSVAERLGLRIRARVGTMTVAGDDPLMMLTAPIAATRKLLERAGMTIADIDLFECNEAFASIPLAWAKELGVDLDLVNVNGGAIALGHPLGCSGARLTVTLLHEMERRGVRYGLQTICEGYGLANAMIIERLD